jgi:hypothetical protein
MRQDQLALAGTLLTRGLPGGDHPGPGVLPRRMPVHQAGALVAVERHGSARRRQFLGRRALPVHLLPARLGDRHHPDPIGDRPEGRARLDRLQLLGIADQHQLGPGPVHAIHQPAELARAHHPGLVHYQHVLGG